MLDLKDFTVKDDTILLSRRVVLMKKISLIVMPILIVLSYVIFGVEYYSTTSSVLFCLYFALLFVLGGINMKIRTIILELVMIGILVLQWYSIDLTIKWLNEMNNNLEWGYGTDFLVIESWLALLILTVTLNFRAYKKLNG